MPVAAMVGEGVGGAAGAAQRASRPAPVRTASPKHKVRGARAWAPRLVGAEAAFYALVVQPGALATRHDGVDVLAHQVNDVGGRVGAKRAT